MSRFRCASRLEPTCDGNPALAPRFRGDERKSAFRYFRSSNGDLIESPIEGVVGSLENGVEL